MTDISHIYYPVDISTTVFYYSCAMQYHTLFPVARWLLRLLSCNKSTTTLLSGCESAISRYCTLTPASKDLVTSAISPA